MATGSVVRFNIDKGWGFITPDGGGPDVMLHVRELGPGLDPAELRPGVRVSYDERSNSRGLRAGNVRGLEDEAREPGYADALTPAEFRDEVSEIMAGAVSQLEAAARRHGWIG